jgi:uncharacterized membrane protein YkoI
MNFTKKPWFIPTLLTVVILLAGGLYIGSLINKKDTISADVIRTQLESMYGGTVDEISVEGDVYKATMNRNGAIYSAEIDAATGSIVSLAQTSEPKIEAPKTLTEAEVKGLLEGKYTGIIDRISLNTNGDTPIYDVRLSKDPKFTNVTVDAITGKTIAETVKETAGEGTLITQEKAIEIARGQLKGQVEEIDDVSYEKTEDGGHYLIEIETKSDRDVVVQIHAISGIVMSVTWEEEEE